MRVTIVATLDMDVKVTGRVADDVHLSGVEEMVRDLIKRMLICDVSVTLTKHVDQQTRLN